MRDEFPVKDRYIYFNNASSGPLPVSSKRAIEEYLSMLTVSGDMEEESWLKVVEETRKMVAQFIGAEPDEIAFIRSTTEGIFLVAQSFPWQPGDNIVTAEGEFPANVYPWLALKERGIKLKFAPMKGWRVDPDVILSLVDERTRFVTLSFVEYLTGQRMPLKYLGEELKKRNVYFFVDAIQGLGVLPLDVREMHIDFLSAGGSKWLLSPHGVGIFYIKKELIDFLKPKFIGWRSVEGYTDFSRYDREPQKSARRFEHSTLNFGGIYALRNSLKLLREIGVKKLEKRVLELREQLKEGLKLKGYRIISPDIPEERSPILTFAPKDRDNKSLYEYLLEKNIITSSRLNFIRLSPHFYNDEEEVEEFLEALP